MGALQGFVAAEARDISGEAFSRFMNDLYTRVFVMVNSQNPAEKLGGVRAIDALIGVGLSGEDAAKTTRFANYLRDVFQPGTQPGTVRLAARALGHLVRRGGPMTSDVVTFEVRRSIVWLQEPAGGQRFAACHILRELAENAPTVFNVHVSLFIGAVWGGLRDPSPEVRGAALGALRACLVVVEQRETRYRVKWYYELFEETKRGARRGAGSDSIHGSLLVIGELLRHTGEFMLARYREVVDLVLRYSSSRERVVRVAVLALVPRLAHFAPERFSKSYLGQSMSYLLASARSLPERPAGFQSLGQLALALRNVSSEHMRGMETHLPAIAALVVDAISPKKGGRGVCIEAVEAAGYLAEGLGPRWLPQAEQLLQPLLDTGLSPVLVQSLEKMVRALPELAMIIRDNLLTMISAMLGHAAQRSAGSAPSPGRRDSASRPGVAQAQQGDLVIIALRTLGTFDFGPRILLGFIKDAVAPFLQDDDTSRRQQAALTAIHLLENHMSVPSAATPEGAPLSAARKSKPLGRSEQIIVDMVLSKSLLIGIADIDVTVRRTLLAALVKHNIFDAQLSQADALRALFASLNDEDHAVRALGLKLSGRLSAKNPAYVLPILRKLLLQLLADLEHSADWKHKGESAHLLGILIASAPRLVLPYVSPILRTLISKLEMSIGTGAVAGTGRAGVAVAVLGAIGELAKVGGAGLQTYMPELLPLVIGALQDAGSSQKRAIAVATLGQLVANTGYVMTPYNDFPSLLSLLLRLLSESDSDTRLEVIKVLGIVGALDPHIHKINQNTVVSGVKDVDTGRAQAASVQAGGNLARGLRGGPGGGGVERGPVHGGEALVSAGMATNSKEYYPTVAINALMQILCDPSVSSHHHMVVRSLMFIFQSLGHNCVPFLPGVLPTLFRVLRSCEDDLRKNLLHQLTLMVSIVGKHIRGYLPELMSILFECWGSPALLVPTLKALEQLSHALRDDFHPQLPDLLPRFVSVLAETERTGDYSCVASVLDTIEAFGVSVEGYFHLLLPAYVRLYCPPSGGIPLQVRQAALKSLARVVSRLKVSGYASALLQPLCKVLQGPHAMLKSDALDAITACAVPLESEFMLYIPTVRKILSQLRIHHQGFEFAATRIQRIFSHRKINESLRVDDGDLQAAELRNKVYDLTLVRANGSDPAEANTNLGAPNGQQPMRLNVNEDNLKKAWECSQRSTKEDWVEWMRQFSVELLRESPSPSLRACYTIAQVQPHIARDMFAAAFVSCWKELAAPGQQELLRSLEAAFGSPTIPTEIVTTLLNLAEFMEHDERPLPVDIRTLGALAEKCHAFAKALHYKEVEFNEKPEGCVEALISIYNQLRQPEAALGVLLHVQRELKMELKESWYEKLERWDAALEAYERKSAAAPAQSVAYLEGKLGSMRCLAALAEWEKLGAICKDMWNSADASLRRELAPTAACAAWHLGQWDDMSQYVSMLYSDGVAQGEKSIVTSTGVGTMMDVTGGSAFLQAVLCVRSGQHEQALKFIVHARELLVTELTALIGESYERAYVDMIRVQQLVELEEAVEYSIAQSELPGPTAQSKLKLIRGMWKDRLWGAQRNIEVWQAILSIRSLVLPKSEDIHTWVKFASLCRKSGRVRQSKTTLLQLLQYDPEVIPQGSPGYGGGSGQPYAMYAFLKHMWSTGVFVDSYSRLQDLAKELSPGEGAPEVGRAGAAGGALAALAVSTDSLAGQQAGGAASTPLLARVYLKLGLWRWALVQNHMTEGKLAEILGYLKASTEVAHTWAKAWHNWAYFGVAALEFYQGRGDDAKAVQYVAPAVQGFFRSIALGQAAAGKRAGRGNSLTLQDILRLLTLWFSHGSNPDVQSALQEGFGHVSIDTWLKVIPQIIARIHASNEPVRVLVHTLLGRIGRHHPQAVIYPLLVACKSASEDRVAAANTVLGGVRQHSAPLVQEAELVSQELIRIAVLWHEAWHEGLEEASRLYFGENNVEGMLNCLLPRHEMLEMKGPETLQEIAFVQAYGRELQEAHEWCNKYRVSRKDSELHQAWDLYYHVFKRINKQLPSLSTLQLEYVAPALVKARDLELAVPGTYVAGEDVVPITSFSPALHVIASKQRPRKLGIQGGDGMDYRFLLKGHEDLRQDERVMQLFGLVNTLLANDPVTAERDLSISRYAVIPLSPNSGLIGWVPHCDTLHALIREYRDARKIPLNLEHRLMVAMAPDYEHLPLVNKVEVFEHALSSTPGDDLQRVFWLKSRSSEMWLDWRTRYTRSLAVMSMVGYILGLGDRHPSNLMIDRFSGKVLHIDFGDCFEASMNREKFPEKVPFRLTRMLVKAMGVSGVEGNFTMTCEAVMRVLRSNRDSVMAMLEAFVHDPLMNWRLIFNESDVKEVMQRVAGEGGPAPGEEGLAAAAAGKAEAEAANLGVANEVLNERAVEVMQRLSDKLTGRDATAMGQQGADSGDLSVQAQIRRLVKESTLNENLCQSYIGWCPFW